MQKFITYDEIMRVSKLIEVVDSLKEFKFDEVKRHLFIGCGSSYNAGLILSEILKKQGIFAEAVSSGEVLLENNTDEIARKFDVALFLSRTGTTTETLKVAEMLKGRIESIGITCEKDSPLSALCGVNYELDFAHEESVVMTSSFSAILRLLLNGIKRYQISPDEYLQTYDSLLKEELLKEKSHFVFLGCQERYYVAKESALKVEEMSLDHTEFYETLEYRHGPIALLSPRTHVVIFSKYRKPHKLETDLANDIANRGGSVHILNGMTDRPEFEVQFLTLYAQLLGYKRAIIKGLNPDKPKGLTKSVILDN
ncbi:MAG: SIS domain-containing protein [Fervidobacterium sp.]|uniref:SIS domain-containing protein n=1 Tax=Fervidobacterium sp. TaxID=1871331 RepID=UPI0030AE416B